MLKIYIALVVHAIPVGIEDFHVWLESNPLELGPLIRERRVVNEQAVCMRGERGDRPSVALLTPVP